MHHLDSASKVIHNQHINVLEEEKSGHKDASRRNDLRTYAHKSVVVHSMRRLTGSTCWLSRPSESPRYSDM